MKLNLLALDYDGTIAERGALDPDVHRALREVLREDLSAVLVTGRRLSELQRLLGTLDLFAAVVAENGAVLHFPRSGRSTLIARPPDPAFCKELRRRGIPFAAGECVVELGAERADAVLAVIRELELPLAILFNRGRLMVLPQSVSKATGLREAARALRLSLHNAVALGDAENDHDLLAACEVGVAVSWGSAALQRAADDVLTGSGPPAVAGFLRRLAAEDTLPQLRPVRRRRLQLGVRSDGQPLSLAVRGRNVVIAGDAQSGKSWVAGLLCEQLILQGYSVCVIDPEGDYTTLDSLPGVVVLFVEGDDLSLEQMELLLRHPDLSVVMDLSKLAQHEKRSYAVTLLQRLFRLRSRTGLPHRIVVDEAHYFLDQITKLLDTEPRGLTLISYRVSQLSPALLASAQAVLVTGESDESELAMLHELAGKGWSRPGWARMLRSLDVEEALLLPGSEESGDRVVPFRIAARLTPHVRHRHKYVEMPVAGRLSFVFERDGRPTGERARSLKDLIEVLAASEEQVFAGHLQRGDFSRWIADVFSDEELAAEVRQIEDAWRAGHAERPHEQIVRAVRERYAGRRRVPVAPGLELQHETDEAHGP